MRFIVLAIVLVMAVPSALFAATSGLQSLVPGWERFFTLEWEPGEQAGRPVVRGRLVNHSPHAVMGVRLLVEGVDGSGRVVSQRVSWVTNGTLAPSTGVTFEVPAPGHHPQYRVWVFAYDRLEGGGSGNGFL